MENREAIEILSRPLFMDGTPKEILDAHRLAISALEKGRWIPVTERLPEDGQLIMAVEKSFEAGFYITRYSDTYHFTFPAWRPLPEPYTEEEA